jgi:hypothetical protein
MVAGRFLRTEKHCYHLGINYFREKIYYVVFNYHYFTAVYWAATSYITKISLFDIVFKYYQIGNLLLICGSIYILGKTVFNDVKQATICMRVYFFTACASLRWPIFHDIFVSLHYLTGSYIWKGGIIHTPMLKIIWYRINLKYATSYIFWDRR